MVNSTGGGTVRRQVTNVYSGNKAEFKMRDSILALLEQDDYTCIRGPGREDAAKHSLIHYPNLTVYTKGRIDRVRKFVVTIKEEADC